jgi:predicted enzyme related to lactoylglutathione lyase
MEPSTHPVVYLELQTSDLPRACAFYTTLFGWQTERIRVGPQSYVVLDLGERIQGGVVERDTEWPNWLPYVEVPNIGEFTARARMLGAAVVLPPREGPAGWRSILAPPAGAQVALWQPKR